MISYHQQKSVYSFLHATMFPLPLRMCEFINFHGWKFKKVTQLMKNKDSHLFTCINSHEFEHIFNIKIFGGTLWRYSNKLATHHWNSVSFCHWNINSFIARKSVKLSLLETHNSIHKFDIICLSEDFLNISFRSDNGNPVLNT